MRKEAKLLKNQRLAKSGGKAVMTLDIDVGIGVLSVGRENHMASSFFIPSAARTPYINSTLRGHH
jgi:hypothetical protein